MASSSAAAAAEVDSRDEGLTTYYQSSLDALELQIRQKQLNLRRLEAQRNEINTKGEIQHLVGWSASACGWGFARAARL